MKTFFNTNNLLAMALMSVAAATGCDEGYEFGEGVADEVSDRCWSCGGVKFNTFLFGKLEASELARDFNTIHDNTRLTQVRLVCPPKDYKDYARFAKACQDKQSTFALEEVWSAKGELRGKAAGSDFKGVDFLKSQWFISFYEEKQIKDKVVLTVNKYEQQPGFHYYTFDYPNPINPKETLPACVDTLDPVSGQSIGTKAVAIEDIVVDTKSGVIDSKKDMIYIACVSGAVGKATTWGFRPYSTIGVGGFTTAVRTVRADYCGDGVSWTTVGNALQVRDVWGYSSFNNTPGPTEALWTEKGAACLGEPRWTTDVKYDDVVCDGAHIQPCKEDWDLSTFSEATIWSKLP